MSRREVRSVATAPPRVLRSSSRELRISGYASTTETPYDLGAFTETIAAGAFGRTLARSPKVVLLLNHNVDVPFAITTNGSLRLAEDGTGLRYDASLDPDDPDARALVSRIDRGLITEGSFAFRVRDQKWSDDREQRRILEVDLHRGDVSCCTYGANETTPVWTASGSEQVAASAGRRGKPTIPAQPSRPTTISTDLARARYWVLANRR